jgi:hypothetical protein
VVSLIRTALQDLIDARRSEPEIAEASLAPSVSQDKAALTD